jgi:hypothetical protein
MGTLDTICIRFVLCIRWRSFCYHRIVDHVVVSEKFECGHF